jgi:hypothetical protein
MRHPKCIPAIRDEKDRVRFAETLGETVEIRR